LEEILQAHLMVDGGGENVYTLVHSLLPNNLGPKESTALSFGHRFKMEGLGSWIVAGVVAGLHIKDQR
jgi:hypothetical protein